MLSRWSLLCVTGVLAVGALVALGKGKPPGKPGGGGGDVPAGTVYLTIFGYDGEGRGGPRLHAMDPDGTGKSELTSLPNRFGEPSREPHGGHRWFLAWHKPEGFARTEIFAYRDDGAYVQLTDQADLRPSGAKRPGMGEIRWSPGDEKVSFLAQRRESGVVTQEGIYSATVVFDEASGDVTGLLAQPTDPIVSGPGIVAHDWSPDGGEIVYAGSGSIVVHDLDTDDASTITSGSRPVWSPDGVWIAFERGWEGVFKIRPAGTDEAQLLKSHHGKFLVYSNPQWSPDGKFLICQGWKDEIYDDDVYRVNADGGGKANLTADVDNDARPVAWR